METPSFLKLVGPLQKEDVIDLACGEGFYTRIYRGMTSGRVIGVDFSENMIKLAKWQQTTASSSEEIQFYQHDCSLPIDFLPHETFDLVTPTFLLQNATSEERFEQMVRNIFNLCKPGGRVVGMGSSMKCPPEKLKRDEKYGRFYTIDDDYFNKNGTKYLVRI